MAFNLEAVAFNLDAMASNLKNYFNNKSSGPGGGKPFRAANSGPKDFWAVRLLTRFFPFDNNSWLCSKYPGRSRAMQL